MSDATELDTRFGDSAARTLRAQSAGQATQVEQARAIAEVRAAVMIAMDRPRDRSAAIAEMREVCGIQGLADRAFFRVPRGGQQVNGESIHLARELARCWGNIDYGVKELARDDAKGQSELLAFAWDLQTNARSEITFIVPHVRGKNNNRLTGTQEIYENNASFAGRRLREAIFSVLPVWFKAEAAEICHETLAKGGGKPLVQRIADLRAAFAGIGVTAEQLEEKRGRRIENFLPEDVGALRVVYGSLKRGEVTIADEFPSDEQPQRPTGSKLAALEAAAESTSVKATPSPAVGELRPDTPPPPVVDAIDDMLGGPPRPAGSSFWTRDDPLMVPGKTPSEFQAAFKQRVAEAVTPHDVERLRNGNSARLEGLLKSDREKLLGVLADREKELRFNEHLEDTLLGPEGKGVEIQ